MLEIPKIGQGLAPSGTKEGQHGFIFVREQRVGNESEELARVRVCRALKIILKSSDFIANTY